MQVRLMLRSSETAYLCAVAQNHAICWIPGNLWVTGKRLFVQLLEKRVVLFHFA